MTRASIYFENKIDIFVFFYIVKKRKKHGMRGEGLDSPVIVIFCNCIIHIETKAFFFLIF